MDEALKREVAEVREIISEEQSAYIQKNRDKTALNGLEASLRFLRSTKPDERSELARRYAVTITEFEKVVAYFRVYVAGDA